MMDGGDSLVETSKLVSANFHQLRVLVTNFIIISRK